MEFRTEEITIDGDLVKVKIPTSVNIKPTVYHELDAPKVIYYNLPDSLREKYQYMDIENIIHYHYNYLDVMAHSIMADDEPNFEYLAKKLEPVELSVEDMRVIFDVERYYLKLIKVIF